MGLFEELNGGLSEVFDLRNDGFPSEFILDGIQVDGALVGEVVKDVVGLFGFRSLLFVAKDEIHPMMQVAGDVFGLQRLLMDTNKLVRIGRPGW